MSYIGRSEQLSDRSQLTPAAPSLHTSQGGATEADGHFLCEGDFGWLRSADPTLYTMATITGTPAAGEQPGLLFTLNYPSAGSTFDIRYTVESGDSNNDVALGISTAVYNAYNSNTGGFKTALNNTLDLQGFGMGNPFQSGPVNQTFSNNSVFSAPWINGIGVTVTAVSSAGTTVSIVSAETASGAPRMDGGPVWNTTRRYPEGYTIAANDLGPYFNFQYRVGSAGYAQLSYLKNIFTGATSNELRLGNLSSGSVADRLGIGAGIYAMGAGSLGDMGIATMSAKAMYMSAFSVVSPTTTDNTAIFGTTTAANHVWHSFKRGSTEYFRLQMTGSVTNGAFGLWDTQNSAFAWSYNADTALLTLGVNGQIKAYNAAGVTVGLGLLATNATDGFLYIPTCAGTPTGTPTARSGYLPLVIDTTNHKLYFYDGSWRDAGP